MKTNAPIIKVKDGLLTVSVFENQSTEGKPFYSITISRSYLDDKTQEWKEAASYNRSDLLRLAKLIDEADSEIRRYIIAHKEQVAA